MEFINKTKNKKLIIPLLGVPGCKLTDTSLRQNITNSDAQFKSLYKLYETFEPDGIFTMMDLSIEVEALGLEVTFSENKYPSVRSYPEMDFKMLEQIEKNWYGVTGRMKVFIDTMYKLAKQLPASVLKSGYVIGPFTLASQIMGIKNISASIITNPDLVGKLLEFSNQVIAEYTNAFFNAGADVITVLEPTAMYLSEDRYKQFSLCWFKELVEMVNNKPLILHICGNTNHLIKCMYSSGAVGISLDTQVDFAQFPKQMPENNYVIGNIDPVKVFLMGTPETVKSETEKLIDTMNGVEKFILSSGCDIPMDTPVENIKMFMDVAKEWKKAN